MNKKEIKDRIEKLKKEIEHHRYLYHILDRSDISEGALDSLKKELRDLENMHPEFLTLDSPSMRVSGMALDKFQKISHSFPVLSLIDIFEMNEFYDWENRNKKIFSGDYDYFCELKLDGLTIVLTYKDGFLSTAATRGDGRVGEDVTNNIKTIESIPLKLKEGNKKIPKIFTVRGEVLLKKSYFEKINKERILKDLEPFANPRNIAAGSIRQLDPSVVRERELIFFAYYFDEDLGQKTHEEEHNILRSFGFKINENNQYCKNSKDVELYLKKWETKRKSLDYMTDGVVIVTNNINIEKQLGSVGKTERWMCAYKFPAEQVTSIVIDIIFQVGRTGAITPVAVLEPRSLAGSVVRRATLHNFDEIKRLDLKLGDTVILQKAGDVIPDIVEVIKGLRDGKEKIIYTPKKCPSCNAQIIKKDEEVNYYCSNKNCYAQQKEGIIHFVSKKAFNIDGLGEKIVGQLIEESLLKSFSDIFRLQKEDIIPLERFAEKSADNLILAISQAKNIDFSKFIYALGIRHVGEETSISLANKFRNIKNLISASQEDFDSIDDIGPAVSHSLSEYFQDKKNKEVIQELLDLGVSIRSEKSIEKRLSGKVFVITGSLKSFTRDEAKNIIRSKGGKISSAVSKNVDYVIVGDDPGSKYSEAQKMGIKIINENEFQKIIK